MKNEIGNMLLQWKKEIEGAFKIFWNRTTLSEEFLFSNKEQSLRKGSLVLILDDSRIRTIPFGIYEANLDENRACFLSLVTIYDAKESG